MTLIMEFQNGHISYDHVFSPQFSLSPFKLYAIEINSMLPSHFNNDREIKTRDVLGISLSFHDKTLKGDQRR
jgi:hypothetical protein